MASLIFIIAIVCDETTVFQHLCLGVLSRYSLRMQPLFFLLQLSALTLSVFVPSAITVIFYTVVIERFVATVERECLNLDQRSTVQATRSLSVDAYLEDTSSTRRRRALGNGSSRAVRSASVMGDTSDTTCRTDATGTGSSSLIKLYKMHPDSKNEPIEKHEVSASALLVQRLSFVFLFRNPARPPFVIPTGCQTNTSRSAAFPVEKLGPAHRTPKVTGHVRSSKVVPPACGDRSRREWWAPPDSSRKPVEAVVSPK